MDVKLVKLSPDSADAIKIRELNDEAFPPEERIPVDYLFDGLEGPAQDMLGIYGGDRFVGFFAMILLGRCAYICYFAICPEARSKGFGGAALQKLFEYYPNHQVVVDFEAPDAAAPNNRQRLRRRNFYLRNGFYPTGYYQYYMDTEFEITCSQPEYDRKGYERLVHAIHLEVPDFEPKHYRKD